MASSMKRLYGVPRMLSWTLTPLTVKTLSYDAPPLIVTVPLGPFVFIPGVRRTELRSVRVTGSLSMVSAERVVAACDVWETVSLCAATVTAVVTPAMASLTFIGTSWPDESFGVLVTVWKPDRAMVTVYSPGGRLGMTQSPLTFVTVVLEPWSAGDTAMTDTPGKPAPASSDRKS